MKKRNRVDEKRVNEFAKELPVELTNDELLERGQQLAQVEQRIRDEETHADAVKRDLKARMGNLLVDRARLADIVRRKQEPRPVQCEGWVRFHEGVYEEVRLDTGEIVAGSRRRLSDEEKQDSLFTAPEPA